MKKFAIAVAAASMLSAVYAESCANAFTGFYAGVQAGMNSTTGTLNMSGYANTLDAAGTTRTQKNNAGKNSFLGGLFAGYGMGVGSCAYVGGELYLNFGSSNVTLFDSSNSSADDRTFKITSKSTYNLGAKVRLGYTVSQQAMIFLGLGLEYSKNTLTATNVAAGQTLAAVSSALVTKKNKKQINFAPSVGMDILLNKNLFVRGEYTYVLGTSQKLSPVTQNAAPAVVTGNVKAKLTQQRFMLGLGYKF